MLKTTQLAQISKKKLGEGRWLQTRYLAREENTGHKVVLEHTEFLSSGYTEAFSALHEFLHTCSSAFLLKVLGFRLIPAENSFKAVFEYVPNTIFSVKDEFCDCPWTSDSLFKQYFGLINALKEAHKAGISHRQISTDTVYYHENSLKLGGFYPPIHDKTALFALYSSQKPRYWSPELRLMLENGEISEDLDVGKADVYALGVVFLQIYMWQELDVLDEKQENVYAVLSSIRGMRGVYEKVGVMVSREPRERAGLEELLQMWRRDGEGERQWVREIVQGSQQTRERRTTERCSRCGGNVKLTSEVQAGMCRRCKAGEKKTPPKPIFPPVSPKIVPQAQLVAPVQSSAEQCTCVVCFRKFAQQSAPPHRDHSSEVIDFCSDACKCLYINSEQEDAFGRHIPDTALFCMQCALPVSVHAIPLVCAPSDHQFCGERCLSSYVSGALSKGLPVVCPACNAALAAVPVASPVDGR